jgi:acyl dehydratase
VQRVVVAGRTLTDLVGVDALTRFGGRFTSQVWPGDTLTAHITVDSVDEGIAELTVSTVNQDGVEVFSGSAAARV